MVISKQRIVHLIKHYFSSLILIWIAILFYKFNRYYSDFLRAETQLTLLYLAIAYTILGFLFYIIVPIEKTKNSKGFTLFNALIRVVKDTKNYLREFTKNPEHPAPKIEKHEKVTLLFMLVKIFFLPLMLNFFFNNYFSVKSSIINVSTLSAWLSIGSFNTLIYPFLLSSIFLLDTLWFCFGYTFEAGFLRNTVRSVEPTVFGWAVAIICYPPFASIFTGYAGWFADDYSIFSTSTITFVARIFVILFLMGYLFATFALGTKCSNLTNRGIVSRGPYRFVRHPAYICKNLAWWITLIPIMGLFSILSMASWTFIYYMRAVTEERHLIKDPDYVEYCKKVKYRFIPGVY